MKGIFFLSINAKFNIISCFDWWAVPYHKSGQAQWSCLLQRVELHLIVLGHESCKRMLFPYLDHMLLRLWQSPKEQSSKTLTCRTICGGGRLTELGHWARRRQSRWHSTAPLCITVSAWVGNRFIFRRRTSQIRQEWARSDSERHHFL